MSDSLPGAEQINLKTRLLKLGIFFNRVQDWIRREARVNAPMDSILFGILFVFMAYFPSLILSILVSLVFPHEEKMTYPPSLFTYNNPDAQEINTILKTVKVL